MSDHRENINDWFNRYLESIELVDTNLFVLHHYYDGDLSLLNDDLEKKFKELMDENNFLLSFTED